MPELKGEDYLRRKLDHKRERVLLRYKYYEMKNHASDLNISSPEFLKCWMPAMGWCAKAVDTLADRLVFNKFKNDVFGMNEIFQNNNPDTFFRSAILSALIGSCSFVYIKPQVEDIPKLQVVDGTDATGIIDDSTGLLTEGYAVLERGDHDKPIVEAYFTPYNLRIIETMDHSVRTHDYPNKVPYPLLVPIIFKPDARRPFGHSRISRACMDIMNSAIRTIKRSEIAAEFYSYPQKYITGLSEEAEPLDKWKASMSSMLMFTKDEDGDKPTIGQFQQQSMTPHVEQLKMFASEFAGETGLTMDDLGFVVDNPSSAEAIKAAHENLRLIASDAQRTFGTGFANVGFLARCVMDDFAYKRSQMALTTPTWLPIFMPDASAMSLIGDGAIKINQAIPGYFDKEALYSMTGIEPSTTTTIIDTETTENGTEEFFTEEMING